MEKIMNLIEGDVGRPIQDIVMNLQYDDLVTDVKEVLDKLNTKEKEVQTKDGHWYKLKIIPYRTIENVIDGAVLTFSDIDTQKKVQERLKDISLVAQVSQEFAESIVNTIKEPLMILDKDLVVRSANTTFYEWFETAPEDVRDRPLSEILNRTWNLQPLIGRLDELTTKEAELENLSAEIVVPKLGKKVVEITARKLLIPSGRSTMILVSIHLEE